MGESAEELYARVFFEYGDDSVAQLGGVHLACEQASNLLTKVLEWGRLMSYLEQSTRYIPYDSRLHGRYRYLRPSEVDALRGDPSKAERVLGWRPTVDGKRLAQIMVDADIEALAHEGTPWIDRPGLAG